MQGPRWWQVLTVAGVVGGLVGAIVSGLFDWRANRLAARVALPRVEVVDAVTAPYTFEEGEDEIRLCRTQFRLANTGGAGTSVIGLAPVGDFGRTGYLPDLRMRSAIVGGTFHGTTRLFGLLVPVVTLDVDFVTLEGPFRYELGMAHVGDDGLLPPTELLANGATDAVLSLDPEEMRLPASFWRMLAADTPFSSMLGPPEPTGLPVFVPAHSVQELVVDFLIRMPSTPNLFSPRSQRWLTEQGIDLDVSFDMTFPDVPPVSLGPVDCSGTVEFAEEVDIRKFYRELMSFGGDLDETGLPYTEPTSPGRDGGSP